MARRRNSKMTRKNDNFMFPLANDLSFEEQARGPGNPPFPAAEKQIPRAKSRRPE
jgi:hypothetical protein